MILETSMYEFEVHIGDPYPPLGSEEADREALENYNERKADINLTRIWQLGSEKYEGFLDHLIGVIIHEFLHLFFNDNEMHRENKEDKVLKLSRHLQILSTEHLLYGEGKEGFEEYFCHNFKNGG